MRGPLNKSTVTVVAEIILGQVLCCGVGLPHLLIISTIATAQYFEQFKDQEEI